MSTPPPPPTSMDSDPTKPATNPTGEPMKAGRRHGASVKTLKRALKKAGLKTTGRKAALTRRAKKAHLKVGGGGPDSDVPAMGGRRRRSRGFRLI